MKSVIPKKMSNLLSEVTKSNRIQLLIIILLKHRQNRNSLNNLQFRGHYHWKRSTNGS